MPATVRLPPIRLDRPETIKARNAAFERLSGARKRVAIARDALAQLRGKRYLATTGAYFSPGDRMADLIARSLDFREEDAPRQFQPIALMPQSECRVCAIGACFVSAVRLADRVTCSSSFDETGVAERYFPAVTLRLMEFCFERNGVEWNSLRNRHLRRVNAEYCRFVSDGYSNSSSQLTGMFRSLVRASELAIRFPNPNHRLEAILKNVIRHKGEFRP